MGFTIRENLSPFYDRGRGGSKIDKIVIHHAATTNFDGIGETFKTKGVSAHYGVGQNNNVDLYVLEINIAYHARNYEANKTSVGIENVNKVGAPSWLVDESTFNTLVELCKDVVIRNGLGKLVVGQNLFGHKDFSATACPASLYLRLQELADRVNGDTSTGPTPPVVVPERKSIEQLADEVIQGKWGVNPDRAINLANAGYDYNAVQNLVNQRLGGAVVAQPSVNNDIVQQVLAGSWGNGDDRIVRLQRAGYDYNAVQNAVNEALGFGSRGLKNEETVADEVIAGSWGNGDDRRVRLENAGYNYYTIQSIVNRKLGY